MKLIKITSLLLFSALIFISLSSCENKNKENENKIDTTTNTHTDIVSDQVQNDPIDTENVPKNNDETIAEDIPLTGDQKPEISEPEPIQTENPFASQTLEEFYGNSAFVGDSVMYGLEIYSRRKKTPQSNATFLTLSSFAARHALSTVNEDSYHPIYNGEKMKVEDALVLDEAQNVFLFLGLNDVRVTPNEYFDNYIRFIDCIKEKSPDINIFIISTTYPIESPHSMDKTTAASYRDQLKDLNDKLYKYCDENSAYYIDVINPLINEKGFLNDIYTSDRYVHLTNTAYDIWTKILDEYTQALIETGLPPVQFEEIPGLSNFEENEFMIDTDNNYDTQITTKTDEVTI